MLDGFLNPRLTSIRMFPRPSSWWFFPISWPGHRINFTVSGVSQMCDALQHANVQLHILRLQRSDGCDDCAGSSTISTVSSQSKWECNFMIIHCHVKNLFCDDQVCHWHTFVILRMQSIKLRYGRSANDIWMIISTCVCRWWSFQTMTEFSKRCWFFLTIITFRWYFDDRYSQYLHNILSDLILSDFKYIHNHYHITIPFWWYLDETHTHTSLSLSHNLTCSWSSWPFDDIL